MNLEELREQERAAWLAYEAVKKRAEELACIWSPLNQQLKREELRAEIAAEAKQLVAPAKTETV